MGTAMNIMIFSTVVESFGSVVEIVDAHPVGGLICLLMCCVFSWGQYFKTTNRQRKR